MEVIAILTAMKEMGFEAGHILSLLVMYFLLRRDVMKFIETKLPEMISEQFEKLIEAIKSHEKTTDKRLKRIEDHVGLK